MQCPRCGSKRLYKDGLRYLTDGTGVQRWLCRNCGYRFTEPNFKRSIQWKNPPFSLNSENILDYNCRGNDDPSWRDSTALGRAVQTLATVEKEEEKRAAGAATKLNASEIHGKLLEFLWWMKKQGYRESTVLSRGQRLRRLVNLGADLLNPESVKEIIAKQENWSEARKQAMVVAYDLFAKWMGLKWDKPIYKPPSSLPFIPLEREIDDLIACCNQHIAAFLRICKETGARAGEIYNLKWTDVDFERQTLRITAEKGSNPRLFRISNALLSALSQLPKNSEYIFHHYKRLNNLRRSFERYRNRAAFKLGNPRLLQITFHTLRHWKATMEYAKTKDILHVMQLLGHKNIKNTLIYTQLVKNVREEEYICKVAKTPREIQELIEAGFEYVCARDDVLFFRKRK
ncbi:MAG: tyrosine-type recombinase/integrase [Candidatus Bathyarchaeia archaeon]